MANGAGCSAIRVVAGLLLAAVLAVVIWVDPMSAVLQVACSLAALVAIVPLAAGGGGAASDIEAESVTAKTVTADHVRITGGHQGGVDLVWNSKLSEFKLNLLGTSNEPLATFLISLDEQRPAVLYNDSTRKMHVLKIESFDDQTRY